MTQRLTTPEIEEVLRHGYESGSPKKFRGNTPYTVIVRFLKQNGEATIDLDPQGDHSTEHIPLASEHGLTPVADRVDFLMYQDTPQKS
jgi:hypothetical protein